MENTWPIQKSRMPSLPAIIDLEASGFGKGSYPIEVGFVLPQGAMYCTLIVPAPNWRHWDPQAENVHHITRDILKAHGKAALTVAQTLNQQLRGLTIYSDGWAHDFSWLGLLFDEAEMTPSFKLDNLRTLLSEVEADAWHTCKQAVLDELNVPRHRASTDARVLQLTFKRLRDGVA